MNLSLLEIRILGSLMEKSVTTPEYYPMTLNALTMACNQKTSRDPVTDYSDDEILAGLDILREEGLAMRVDVAGSRVPKFRHILDKKWELERPSYALLCILFLRGAQTVGQLRQRCERLFAFEDLDEVQSTLESMQDRADEPKCLIEKLERSPGTKEIRYRHCLGQHATSSVEIVHQYSNVNTADSAPGAPLPPISERMRLLENRVEELEQIVTETVRAFEKFKQQFE
jgi:uncharacterized protein YceH (UPF0502 family)